MSDTQLSIQAVGDKAALDAFIKVPWSLYADDPQWVPPLRLERQEHLSPKHNPYFQRVRWCAWVAYRAGQPVGRISAQVDPLYIEHHGDKTGFFGFIEAPDDPSIFKALFDTAEAWLTAEGMEHVQGPYNLSINQECGLLVHGFDTPPQIMMGHAPQYTDQHIRALGYEKAKDLLAYRISPDFERPTVMEKLVKRYHDRLTVRPLRRKDMKNELEIMRQIFNDAWSENWGFIPFTYDEFQAIGKDLGMLVKDDMIQIAEVDGKPAAFIVVLPNVNEAIRDLNGNLLPIGWAKLLWRLKVRFPQSARVPLLGVRKQFHNTPLGPGMTFLVVHKVLQPLLRYGVKDVEMSWILEDNRDMRSIIESCDGRAYKTYRLYQKALKPVTP